MKENPIGIFDSGIGGITILNEILKLLPDEQYIYYSDSIHNPYGEKNQEEVIQIVDSIIQFFLEKQCKAIIFACNTATALAIDEMRERYPEVIIIGTEPAYKMIHDYCPNSSCLILATPQTMSSDRFQKLYQTYDNKHTTLLSCPRLANLIEQNQQSEIERYLVEKLTPFMNDKIEAIVLGCTHYPLIKTEIKKVLGNVTFFDGGEGIAKQLKKLLIENNIENSANSTKTIEFIDSSNNLEKQKRFLSLLNKK